MAVTWKELAELVQARLSEDRAELREANREEELINNAILDGSMKAGPANRAKYVAMRNRQTVAGRRVDTGFSVTETLRQLLEAEEAGEGILSK